MSALNPDELHIGLKKSLVPWLGKTMKHIDILLNSALQNAGFELTKKQFLLMKFISRGIQEQSRLCVITERDKSSLTRLIQGLEKKGLITREVNDLDKRKQQVNLTSEGLELLKSAEPIIESNFELIESGISKEELEIAKRIIQKILANTESELNHLHT